MFFFAQTLILTYSPLKTKNDVSKENLKTYKSRSLTYK